MKKIQRKKYEIGGILQAFSSPQIVEGMGAITSQFAKGGQFHVMSKKDRERLDELQKKEDDDRLTKAENDEYEKLVKEYRRTKEYKGKKHAKGGKIGFDALSKKVAKSYEGDKVKPKYQKEYGETYSKKEAKEVGDKVAAKVYRQQLAKNKMAKGGEFKGDSLQSVMKDAKLISKNINGNIYVLETAIKNYTDNKIYRDYTWGEEEDVNHIKNISRKLGATKEIKIKLRYRNGELASSEEEVIYENDSIMAKGGNIDKDDIEKRAIFYTDESRWSIKPTISKFESENKELKETLRKLENKEITPSKIIGGGYKSSAIARKIAFQYLEERILVNDRAIEILKERGEKFAKGGLAKVEIVNEGEVFDDKKYSAILGDFDFDGLPNVDDLEPLNKSNKDQIEQLKFSKTFKELLETKKDLDIDMDKFVAKLRQTAPKDSKIYARTKTPFSILNKLVSSRLLNEKHGLKDLVGTTIAFDNIEDLKSFKNKTLAGKYGRVLDFDDYYENPKDGYRAYHFIVEQGGVPIELQLKTERMKDINVLSHDAYKQKRLNGEYLDYLTNLAKDADNGNKFASREFDKLMTNKAKVQKMLTI